MPTPRKLTQAQADEVGRRIVQGESATRVAAEFGIARSSARQIAKGWTYRLRGSGRSPRPAQSRRAAS